MAVISTNLGQITYKDSAPSNTAANLRLPTRYLGISSDFPDWWVHWQCVRDMTSLFKQQPGPFQIQTQLNVQIRDGIFKVSITQTEHLRPGCSDQSYYECIEAALAEMEECTDHGGLCEYVSLPHSLLPVCQSGDARKGCSRDVFTRVFNDDDHHCRHIVLIKMFG